MAIGIENYVNISGVTAAYPKGNITDDPTGIAGTPVDVNTYQDMHQTLMKILLLAGTTASGLPDNATNGYQYIQALATLVDNGFKALGTGAWTSGGTPTITVGGGGTFTGATFTYNKYKQVGKTFYWTLQVRAGTVAGTVTGMSIQAPPAFYGSGSTWANNGGKTMQVMDYAGGGAGASIDLGVILNVDGGGFPIIQLFNPLGNIGAGSLSFDINIVAEIG